MFHLRPFFLVGLIPGKPSPAKQSIGLPKNFESCLVDTIRLGTNCSYADCRSVYHAIVDLLSTIPELKQNFQGYNSVMNKRFKQIIPVES
ncbi:uncharacterized protein DC041_0001606 [Schistosoma bovis]|uniref:Uncharacterized protein n=1 Tax=Schistosoma bovis TaxID=6184 RepID=A0A430Q5S6_SCHBO|nr:uncharacterized protein DC041_0001606 [Schistosoma bovis]